VHERQERRGINDVSLFYFSWFMAAVSMIAALRTLWGSEAPRSRTIEMTAGCYLLAAIGFVIIAIYLPN